MTHRDPMDFSDLDYLEGVDGPAPVEIKIIPELAAAPVAGVREPGTYPCGRCNGTGETKRYVRGMGWGQAGVPMKCPACQGRGAFKKSPEERAKNRAQRAALVAKKRDAIYADIPGLKDALEWRAARGSDFALSLQNCIETKGVLSDRQIEVARKLVRDDEERAARRAAEREASKVNVAGAGLDKMVAAFDRAKASGLSYLKMWIGGYLFTVASATSKNPGALYVKRSGGDREYLGKILRDGVYQPTREASEEDRAAVATIAQDPAAAAKAHGLETGRCSCCGRELTNKDSIEMGIGPICLEKWFGGA